MTETLDPVQADQRRLIEENAAIQEMMQTPGWHVYARYAQAFLAANQRLLASGNLEDIAAYKFMAGRVQGAQQVLDVPYLVEQAKKQALEPDERYVDDLAIAELPYLPPHADEGD